MTVGLVLGDLDLMDPEGSPFAVETLAEGTDWGNPQPIEVAVRSLLQDGSIVVHQGDDNREVSLRVIISAPDSAALAEGEAALMAELYRANTLTYTPADGWGPPTVFSVVTSSLAHTMDDLGEVRGERTWSVRLVCEPFGRSVNEVSVAPTPTTIGTARQQLHSLTNQGSVRTDAAFKVEHETSSLGEVLVYTFPDDGRDYSPSLRQYATTATAAGATADSTLVSGARNELLGTMTDLDVVDFDVPTDRLHSGRHLILVRMRGDGAGGAELRTGVQTRIGSTVLAGQSQLSAAADADMTTDWRYVVGGVLTLPMVDIGDQSSAVVRVTLRLGSASAVDVDVDEAWLFNLSVGQLTQADCGSGTAASGGPSRRLFIETPTTSNPRMRILRGHAADMTDAFSPGGLIGAWGAHILAAGDSRILTVTPNATSAALTVTYPPRWHTHAAI
jgi:hypothetical protein